MHYYGVSLDGRTRNFSLPKNKPLLPLFEAVVNSINAIEERKSKLGYKECGNILIKVIREYSTTVDVDVQPCMVGFDVIDNGIGFDEDNIQSFIESDSPYKAHIGGKGVGRFTWLKAFNEISIESTYKSEGEWVKRTFNFAISSKSLNDTLVSVPDQEDFETIVHLMTYKKEYSSEVPKQVTTLAMRIIQHCLVYLLDNDCPEIKIVDNDDSVLLNSIFIEHFKPDKNKVPFVCNGNKFELLNIRIEDKGFENANKLYLCANNRMVDTKSVERYITDLDSQIYEKMKFWYVGVVTGQYFDENVDANRLSFDIPDSRNLISDSISLEGIVYEACEKVKEYLSDFLTDIAEEKMTRIRNFVTEKAPQYRHLLRYMPEEVNRIKPGLTDDKLDDELHSIKRVFEKQTALESERLLEQSEFGLPDTEDYKRAFNSLVSKVSDANQSLLANYVIHRRAILNLFERGLMQKDSGGYCNESYMHNLLFPMRSTTDDEIYQNHNLWMIDEKLSYSYFISSDIPFNNDPKEKRVDILVLDGPVAVSDQKNEGTIFNSITIFELKKPMRNDYTISENPITQLVEYASRIKSGKAKDKNGRLIRANDSTQFYLYAICDSTARLETIITHEDLTPTPDQMGYFKFNRQLNAYIEILSFDKILQDSKKRNRVLFDRLGIQS